MDFHHTSVLLNETIAALVKNSSGIYVDCTLGGGGHAAKIASQLNDEGRFIGIDQDPAAIRAGQERLKSSSCKLDIVQANFSEIEKVLDQLGIEQVDGILFDLGVSSHQLDVAERGFSYMHNGPLDMRMNPNNKFSAYDIVNSYTENELSRIIFQYGEERWAKRIAKFIVEARARGAINTTYELVDIIKNAIPSAARRSGPHPAKRTFQAIRIEVNRELEILKDTFISGVNRLKSGGCLCVITFHSLEDRITKQTMQELAKGCICPPHIPICVCNKKPIVKAYKPVSPSNEELEVNPRARSAKLRVAQKL